jgi:hypothetical protein
VKPVAVLLSLLLATTAYAADEVTPIDVCKDFSVIARDIMKARQMGDPLSETLPNALKQFSEFQDRYGIEPDEEGDKHLAALVMAAYEAPIMQYEEFQQSAIDEFENEFFAECYKEMTSDSEE